MILRAAEIAEATRGRLRHDGPAGPIAIDSRRLQPGEWFLALVGDRFDGHDFVPQAHAAGCAGIIASRPMPEGWERGWVEVPDTLVALQDLARYGRSQFSGPVVGITGSAGKTTTRAMAALVLEAFGPVHQTPGNLNNHVGLPLTILRAPPGAASWVLELGMNHFGEIALLQEIARPTVRLITNVGAAHLEYLGDVDGVARAKGELFDGARQGDVCCVNADDPRVAALSIPEGVRVIRFGHAGDFSSGQIPCNPRSQKPDVRLTEAIVDPVTLETRFRVQTPRGAIASRLEAPGIHLAMNACAAIAVGVALGVPVEGMGERLARYAPVGMRLRVEDGPGGVRVINDAYNANPLSTAASLRTLAAVRGARRVALLGDMLELGSHEDAAHAEILDLAQQLGIEVVGVAGPRYLRAAAGRDVVVGEDARALGRAVAPVLRPGDVVLLKGSRRMTMERVLLALASSSSRS